MNSSSSRKTYGTLHLTSATHEALQLEFAMIEAPAPRARFLNFPLADETPANAERSEPRRMNRKMAA